MEEQRTVSDILIKSSYMDMVGLLGYNISHYINYGERPLLLAIKFPICLHIVVNYEKQLAEVNYHPTSLYIKDERINANKDHIINITNTIIQLSEGKVVDIIVDSSLTPVAWKSNEDDKDFRILKSYLDITKTIPLSILSLGQLVADQTQTDYYFVINGRLKSCGRKFPALLVALTAMYYINDLITPEIRNRLLQDKDVIWKPLEKFPFALFCEYAAWISGMEDFGMKAFDTKYESYKDLGNLPTIPSLFYTEVWDLNIDDAMAIQHNYTDRMIKKDDDIKKDVEVVDVPKQLSLPLGSYSSVMHLDKTGQSYYIQLWDLVQTLHTNNWDAWKVLNSYKGNSSGFIPVKIDCSIIFNPSKESLTMREMRSIVYNQITNTLIIEADLYMPEKTPVYVEGFQKLFPSLNIEFSTVKKEGDYGASPQKM